jgi:hypothetical protein
MCGGGVVTPKEREEIVALGRDPDDIAAQLLLLRQGPRYRAIDRPCAIGDGIHALDAVRQDAAIAAFDASRFGAFVPASGAASRMFAHLEDDVVRRVPSLAVWPTLGLPDTASPDAIREALIARWSGTPKGLVPFHHCASGYRTPIDEHLAECEALGVRRRSSDIASPSPASTSRSPRRIRGRTRWPWKRTSASCGITATCCSVRAAMAR